MLDNKVARYKSRESLKIAQKTILARKAIKNDPFLRELDEIELYEWAHLKFLKANRLLKKKKVLEVTGLLTEIVEGIESKHWETMNQRIIDEIKLPALKKLRELQIKNKSYQEALESSEKIIELESSEENKNFYIRLKKALENRSVSDDIRLLENRIVIEMPSMNKVTKSEEDNELNEKSTLHASEEEKVLKYNDELEDMRHMGIFRYILYPIRVGVKSIGSVFLKCRKRKNPTESAELT